MPESESRVGSPGTIRNPFSSLLSKLTRTPKHKVAIQPTHEEMHPSQHQQSTTKPLDEARWLGFMPMTEPAKVTRPDDNSQALSLSAAQATPTRATQSAKAEAFYTPPPELKLPAKRKSSFDAELSPEARRIMEETRQEAANIRARMTAAKEKQEAQDHHAEQLPVFGLTDVLGARKIAKPRGRFSDAHKKAFGGMDSIANHPSAFRAAPTRKTESVPLKPKGDQPPKQLKRTHSKTELGTPQKSNLPVKTSFTPIPPRDTSLLSPAKRLRHVDDVDASTARNTTTSSPVVSKPADVVNKTTARVKTGIPLPRSNLSTPTKASIARSQSAKSLRHATSVPKLAKVASTTNLAQLATQPPAPSKPDSPSKIPKSPSVRSILRSGPTLLYSNDPAKIAAGTHVPTPKRESMMPKAPATAPVIKHVDFTESTKERAELSELLSSPSSASTEKKRKVLADITTSPSTVTYPSLTTEAETSLPDQITIARPIAVPKSKLSRRQTMGSAPTGNITASASFTFRANGAPSFAAPTATSTIRRVRNSDVPAPLSAKPAEMVTVSKKRKLELVDEDGEDSDKENSDKSLVVTEGSPTKKVKSTTVKHTPVKPSPVKMGVRSAGTAAQKAAKKSLFSARAASNTTPAASPKKGGLTLARLNLLATPKKRHA